MEDKSILHNDMDVLSEEIGAAIKRFHAGDKEHRSVIFCSNDGDQNGVVTVGSLAQILDDVASILMHLHRQRQVDWTTLRALMIVAMEYIEQKDKEVAPSIIIPFTENKPS